MLSVCGSSTHNSGNIAIGVAVVIEPMPLICSATWALPSKNARAGVVVDLFVNSSINAVKMGNHPVV